MSYPVLLRLENRTCVIVGGGNVAARKAEDLLDAGALVIIISAELSTSLRLLSEGGRLQLHETVYASGMLAELRPFLVFAATDSRVTNQQIAHEARSVGALVDTVDSSSEGDFSSMATIRRGRVIVAISTGGGSPALAAHLQARLDEFIGMEYGTLADWLSEFRPTVRERITTDGERRALWQAIVESSALDLLRHDDPAKAREIVESLVNEALKKAERRRRS